jgi:hypothetical protein
MRLQRKYQAYGGQWYSVIELDDGHITEIALQNAKEEIDEKRLAALKKVLDDAANIVPPIDTGEIDRLRLANELQDLKTKIAAIGVESTNAKKLILLAALIKSSKEAIIDG